MNVADIPLMSALQERMHYLGARHATIAQNIANADTPGYIPRDVRAPSTFMQAMANANAVPSVNLWRTSPMHMGGVKSAETFKTYTRNPTAETNPNGNQVSIEEEVEKMSMNQSDYNQATALYRSMISMFNSAIGKPGGQ